jgi:hypothetical protein
MPGYFAVLRVSFFIHDDIVCLRCLRRLLPTFEICVPTGWFLVIAGATDYGMSAVVILGYGYVAQWNFH